MSDKPRRLVVGISGASGAIFGIRTLQHLQTMGIETHLVLSPAAQRTILLETDWSLQAVEDLADYHYKYNDIGAAIASGAFTTNGMIIIPCSIKTLSAIAHSYAADLLVRAADVSLKEGRPLLLAVREAPLHKGHLSLMKKAADLGAIIHPPIPSFYNKPEDLDTMINHMIGRMLLRMGIENDLYGHWPN